MASFKKFQAPRGTRDFYPADMALRRYIEGVWRSTSINHGFDEVEGPTIEHLSLYTHKSGPGIVSELFQVYSGKDEQQITAIRSGEDAPYALRPEFTPTLARMVAAKAAQLPRPIKWFAIPCHYRAERPQRGRLREFIQWNVDFIGSEVDSAKADAEVIACAIGALERFGLTPQDITVRLSNRESLVQYFRDNSIPDDKHQDVFDLLDRMDRITPEQAQERAIQLGLDESFLAMFAPINGDAQNENGPRHTVLQELAISTQVTAELDALGLSDWYAFDPTIVRGLAYYTGTVFEIIAQGERAVAGGGRYDKLIESFGGPSLPACGFGMGDVVLSLLLHDKGLLPEEIYMRPLRPHSFVIAASDEAAARLPGIVTILRRAGYHIRHSYRTTRNVGKLLGEAGKTHARTAIILGDELAQNQVALKDLEGGQQHEVALDDLQTALREMLREQDRASV